MSSDSEPLAGLQVAKVSVGGMPWRVAWRVAPAGDARPPLLVCNGIGGNLELLAPLLRALHPRPVIAFDAPGAGDTPPAAHQYWLGRLADWVAELAGHLDAPVFDVLGVSWGGALAQQVALQWPRRCRRVVLAATSMGWASIPGRPSALLHMADRRRLGDPAHATRVLPQVYGGDMGRDPAVLLAYLRHVKPPSRAGYAQQALAVTGWSSLWWLPLLRQRTLLLAGREDPLVPLANARLMHALLRGSELEVIDDGHLFLHTRAAQVAPRITAFLDS